MSSSSEAETEKIKKQIEFYFGDGNYPRDNFLQKVAKENDGWIPVATLLTFNRLKQMTTDPEVVVQAARKSIEGSAEGGDPLLEVSGDGLRLRRVRPVPDAETLKVVALKRTLYVKGFPETLDLDQITAAFQEFKILAVRMRKFQGAFKGAVYVEFENEEEAKRYKEVPKFFNEIPLEVKTKEEADMEEEDKKKKKGKAQEKGKKKDEKKDEKKEEKPAEGEEKTEGKEGDAEAAGEGEGEGEGDDDDDEEGKEGKKEYPKDCLLHFENVGGETDRETLKTIFGEFGKVSFVDFSKGKTEGYIRFDDAGGAANAVKTLTEKETEIDGAKPKLRVLEGDEEKEYWGKLRGGEMKSQNSKRGGRGGGRGGRGGRRGGGRGGKRKRGNEDQGGRNKKQK